MKNCKKPTTLLGISIDQFKKVNYQNNDKIGRGWIYYKNQNDPNSIRYAIVYGTLQLNV